MTATASLLVIQLRDGALYGLPLDQVQQVLELTVADILPVPQMPDHVVGVCRFQDKVLWLVDPLLGGIDDPLTVVVVRQAERSLGVVIQALVDISPEVGVPLLNVWDL